MSRYNRSKKNVFTSAQSFPIYYFTNAYLVHA